MFKKSILLSGMLLAGVVAYSQSPESSGSALLPSLFPQWQNTHVPDLSDADLYGPALSLPGATPVDKAHRFLSGPLVRLGLRPEEWQLVRNTTSRRFTYVSYVRQVDGRKVRFDHLRFQFAPDGTLVRLQIAASGEPASIENDLLSIGAATGAASTGLAEGERMGPVLVQPAWEWFPVRTGNTTRLTQAYRFTAEGTSEAGQLPARFEGWIDARTGELLYRHNHVKSELKLTLKGRIKAVNDNSPLDTVALPNLLVTEGANSYYTDANGRIPGTATALPATVSLPLKGLWSQVYIGSFPGPTPTYNLNVTDTGTVHIRTDSQYYQNAYYHVNRIHDFVNQELPGFTGMDITLPTVVDITTGSCNAFYNGSSINFFAESAGCKSMAKFADIIYHEYGHGINDRFYDDQGAGTMYNGALNEGYADIWAFLLTKYPVMGQGAVGNTVVRRYDTHSRALPVNIAGLVHSDGEIIAGAWWDVAVNLGDVDSMRPLFIEALYAVNDGLTGNEGALYRKVLVSALLADDDDNNLNNGTPHFQPIIRAFAKHGIYLGAYTTGLHNELPHQPATVPIDVPLSLNISYPAVFQDATLFYRARGGTANWDSTAMVPGTANAYTAQIPAQAEGTVLDYYFRVRNALAPQDITYYPAGFRPELPPAQCTLPYQVGVGLRTRWSQNFETDTTGWSVGNNNGDDATTGRWIWGTSNATNQTGGGGSPLPIQPAGDHTTGTGKSLFTGNGSNVGNGQTSVLSPYLDLTGYDEPIIEYYRWFSNDRGQYARNDLWRVRLQDSVQGYKWIDQTLQSDYQWRRRLVRVRDYYPTTMPDQVQLQFLLADNGYQNTLEGAIDDVVLYDLATPSGVAAASIPVMGVYPNPADAGFRVVPEAPLSAGSLLLYDLQGKVLQEIPITAGKSEYYIPTTGLASGAYFLLLKTPVGQRLQKVTVRH